MLQEVQVSADAAEVVKAHVSEIKAAAETLVSAIAVDTELALGKLAKAKPALDEAEAALNVITFQLQMVDNVHTLMSTFRRLNQLILRQSVNWENHHI